MSGGDRYQDALLRLTEVHKASKETPLTVDQQLAFAQVEATLALAATAALPLVLKHVGEDDHTLDAITDWARTITPNRSAVAKRCPVDAHIWPANWPPKSGEVWRDNRDETWAVMASGKLVPLANDIDDHPRLWPADEVESKFGPMARVSTAWDKVPF